MQRANGGPGLSVESWNIVAKIRDVDRVMTPALQERVVEAHPELAFAAMNAGHPLRFSKKTAAGRSERVLALTAWLPGVEALVSRPRPRGVAADDLLDALALVRTAERLATGVAWRLPEHPCQDARGLRMEIWA